MVVLFFFFCFKTRKNKRKTREQEKNKRENKRKQEKKQEKYFSCLKQEKLIRRKNVAVSSSFQASQTNSFLK